MSDFDGRDYHERQLLDEGRWLRKIQKVDVRERKQRRYRFGACGRSTGGGSNERHPESARTFVSDQESLKV